MDDLVARHAKRLERMIEQPARRLVGASLLRRDHAVDMAAELRDVARDDRIVGVDTMHRR